MMRLVTSSLLALAACQKSEPPSASQAPAAAIEAQAPAAAPAPELRVEPQPDGTLKLVAKDKWGGAVDTVYENLTFLENAIPALERGFTPEQTQKLKAEVQRLKETSK